MVLGIVAGVFITRIIGAQGRGVYTIFQSDIELFTLVFSFSLNSGLVYFVANKKIALEKLLGISIVFFLTGVVLFSVSLGIIKLFFTSSFVFPPECNTAFYNFYLLAGFAFALLNTFFSGIFQGKSLFKVVNNVAIANSIFNVTFFSVFYVLFRNTQFFSVKSVLCITLLVYFLNTCMWLGFFIKHFSTLPSFKFSINDNLKLLLSFVILGHIGTIINFLNYRIDRWFLEAWKDSEQLGYYSLAVGISEMFLIFSRTVSSVVYPYFSKGNTEESIKYLAFFSRIIFTVSILFAVAVYLTANSIVPMVYGKEFINSVVSLQILIIGVLFSSFSTLFSTYIVANNKIKLNVIGTSISFIFTIILDILLIPKYGIIGASVASVCSYIVKDLFIFFVYRYTLNGPFMNYFIVTGTDVRLILSKISGNG